MQNKSEETISEAQDALVGELTAALAAESMTAEDRLPAHLASKAIEQGESMVRAAASVTAPMIPRVAAPPAAPTVAPSVDTPKRGLVAWSGWLAAAAVMAIWLVSARDTKPENVVPTVAQTTGALRDSLTNADNALTKLAWAPSTDVAALGAGGDVVWSNRAQRGVMRFVGLQPNDRSKWQYQLWIFDKARDQRYPVDGGVFDIPAGATEVLVPISARVPVGEAVLFAVTIEPPGGVVVSTRERIALLAKL